MTLIHQEAVKVSCLWGNISKWREVARPRRPGSVSWRCFQTRQGGHAKLQQDLHDPWPPPGGGGRLDHYTGVLGPEWPPTSAGGAQKVAFYCMFYHFLLQKEAVTHRRGNFWLKETELWCPDDRSIFESANCAPEIKTKTVTTAETQNFYSQMCLISKTICMYQKVCLKHKMLELKYYWAVGDWQEDLCASDHLQSMCQGIRRERLRALTDGPKHMAGGELMWVFVLWKVKMDGETVRCKSNTHLFLSRSQ